MLQKYKEKQKKFFLIKNKKADIELDQLGKLIIGIIVFIILLYFVSVFIGGKITQEDEAISGIFRSFR